MITKTEEPTTSLLLDENASPDPAPAERTEPDLDVYADALLLVVSCGTYFLSAFFAYPLRS